MTTTKQTDAQSHAEIEAARLTASVQDAHEAFDRAVRILQQSCKELEAEGVGKEGDLLKDVRSVNSILQHTLQQREKAREAGIERFGKGGQGELDLDAARSEIGLRLACLRERGGDEQVPE